MEIRSFTNGRPLDKYEVDFELCADPELADWDRNKDRGKRAFVLLTMFLLGAGGALALAALWLALREVCGG